jgi:hypothetical protein
MKEYGLKHNKSIDFSKIRMETFMQFLFEVIVEFIVEVIFEGILHLVRCFFKLLNRFFKLFKK